MGLIVTNAGEKEIMDWALKSTGEALTLKLFTNDYVPVATTDAATHLTEATFTGYAAQSLSRSGWSDSTTDSTGQAVSNYGTAQQFDASSSETIYGYWIESTTGGVTLWAERFAESRPLANGDSLTLTPKLVGRSIS